MNPRYFPGQRVCVGVKRVPDTETLVWLDSDEVAGEMVVVTLGDEAFKETLRRALAMRAD